MSAVIVVYDGLLAGARLVRAGSVVNTHVIDAKLVVVVTGRCVFNVFLLSDLNEVVHGLADAVVMVVLFFLSQFALFFC